MKAAVVVLKVLVVCVCTAAILWYMASAIVNIGSVIGAAYFFVVGAFTVYTLVRPGIFKRLQDKKILRALVAVFVGVVSAVALYAAVLSGFMIAAANNSPTGDETLVVLGCGVNGDRPSLMLYDRIKMAEQYLKEHPDAVCVASGGQGNRENISEAQCIKNELVYLGIDSGRIYIEDKSSDTRENIKNTLAVIEQNNLNKDMTIVTDAFHELRASIITSKLGATCSAYPSQTSPRLLLNFATREILALTAELLGL